MLLPAELIDYIFRFLRGDTLALKACSKAHPVYSRLAERHLYANLVVLTTNPWRVSELYKEFSENARILNYPRTLDFRAGVCPPVPDVLSIISMIPRMANLKSLTLSGQPRKIDLYEDFLSTLKICLRQSSVEEVNLHFLSDFPFSVLDDGRNIKKLTLTDCTAREEPMSSSGSPHQSLETLIIRGDHDPDLLFWTTRRATRLTTLELRLVSVDQNWTAFPELLAACSNSLTRLHLDVAEQCQSIDSLWIDNMAFPFTLSSHMCLEKLSIFAPLYPKSASTEIQSALPAITRLIRTAPFVQDVALSFHCEGSNATSLGRLDWSPLDRLRCDFAGIRPRIDLRISGGTRGRFFSPASILGVLGDNKGMMDLVNRNVVILKPEQTRGDGTDF